MQIPYELVKKLWEEESEFVKEGEGFSHLQCLVGFDGDGQRIILTPMNWYDYKGDMIPPAKASHMPSIKATLERSYSRS